MCGVLRRLRVEEHHRSDGTAVRSVARRLEERPGGDDPLAVDQVFQMRLPRGRPQSLHALLLVPAERHGREAVPSVVRPQIVVPHPPPPIQSGPLGSPVVPSAQVHGPRFLLGERPRLLHRRGVDADRVAHLRFEVVRQEGVVPQDLAPRVGIERRLPRPHDVQPRRPRAQVGPVRRRQRLRAAREGVRIVVEGDVAGAPLGGRRGGRGHLSGLLRLRGRRGPLPDFFGRLHAGFVDEASQHLLAVDGVVHARAREDPAAVFRHALFVFRLTGAGGEGDRLGYFFRVGLVTPFFLLHDRRVVVVGHAQHRGGAGARNNIAPRHGADASVQGQ
mmetsp:Transcript_40984/g.80195  ORF Transcript_40984/g.80195 Transcript_40984/m.80195 type:complete len:332 (+) Transcript_40984:614-1609(+)